MSTESRGGTRWDGSKRRVNYPLWNNMSQLLFRSQTACSFSGIKTRRAATLVCAHCRARHQCKHHRNKNHTTSFLGILVAPQYFGFHIWSLCCPAEYHSTLEESCVYVTPWGVTECYVKTPNVYFHCSVEQIMCDMSHKIVSIKESPANAQFCIRWQLV